MNENLTEAVEKEIEKLKSLETTLDLMHLSAKQHLTTILSSSKRKQHKEQSSPDLHQLSDIKANLF